MTKFSDHNETYRKFLREIEAQSLDETLATNHWIQRCRELKEDARNGSQFDFLRWRSLGDFSVPDAWIPPVCYLELRNNPEWHRKWFELTRESKIGHPRDFSQDFGTSPILIQHAYHLLTYETVTSRSLLNCEVIFEIGGGYGSFCRLLRNAGFSGLHVIYDLPHISSIQRLFLTLSGLTEVPFDQISKRAEHGFCLITSQYLDDAFNFFISSNSRVGFVATWSLSESPMSVRERIFPRFHGVCEQYLIAFQPAWENINNFEYFSAFPVQRPNLKWWRLQISMLPSWYLFA